MPSSPAEAPADAVAAILALERCCLDADAAFVERRWDDVSLALTAQDRLTGALAAIFARTPEHAPARDGAIAERLRGVLAYREDQLRRVRAYRDECARRIEGAGRVRALHRAVGRHEPAPALYDTQR